jgi:hypothetical protein
LEFAHRSRYESIGRRYGDVLSGDQQLPQRTRMQIDGDFRAASFRLELQHSTVRLNDSGSLVTNQHISVTPLIQANGTLRWKGAELSAGRFTMDLGSRRLIARNVYRNTTNTFDGAQIALGAAAWQIRGFVFRPAHYIGPAGMQQRLGGRLAGGFASRAAGRASTVELYGLHLDDSASSPVSLGRGLWTGGGRWYQPPAAGAADFEVEMAIQRGNAATLRKRAAMFHGGAGFSIRQRWQPRLGVAFDYSSGDRDPADNRDNAFDPLFGARRFELGPTGIHGVLSRSNLASPIYGFSVWPAKPLQLDLSHRWIRLASARDGWRATALSDPAGQAGVNVGHQFEARLRAELHPYAGFEGGYTVLAEGPYIERLLHRDRRLTSYVHFGLEFRIRAAGRRE